MRNIGKALLEKQDPVAILIAENEKSLPAQCPKVLQMRINIIQTLVSYLKVFFVSLLDFLENGISQRQHEYLSWS